jgi:DNA-binding FadR family transcriptional regulator
VTAVGSDRAIGRQLKSSEVIAESIRRQIVLGELQPGDALPSEAEMTASFQVSRPTMREALRILEAERLIHVLRGAHGGARVRFPDSGPVSRSVGMLLQLGGTTLADVWEARMILEPPLARAVAEQRDPAVIAALRASIQRHHDLLHDDEAFSRETVQFHDLVLKGAGNQTLHLVAEILDEVFVRHAQRVVDQHVAIGDQAELNRVALRVHTRLLEILESGDGERAESAWRQHLEHTGKVMLDLYGPTTVIDLYRG